MKMLIKYKDILDEFDSSVNHSHSQGNFQTSVSHLDRDWIACRLARSFILMSIINKKYWQILKLIYLVFRSQV